MRVMPRNNRNTVKHHRTEQRSKVLRALTLLGEAERSTLSRVINARPEQVGRASMRLVIGLLLVATALAFAAFAAPRANARVVNVDGPEREVIRHNYVAYHTHVTGTRWTYLRLRDGSEWMATRCRQEDSRNCWWNAATRGTGEGTSFLNINGHRHYVRDFTVTGS